MPKIESKRKKEPPVGTPSRCTIPPNILRRLWARSAGHCQYDGCSENLYRDDLTQVEMNNAYVAHIVAAEPNGPRGNDVESPLLAADPGNLMLLCDKHHRLIDRDGKDSHSVELLREMKHGNEDRVEMLVKIPADKKSHVVLFGAKIGDHSSPLNSAEAGRALLPHRFPASPNPIKLALDDCAFEDGTRDYWDAHEKNLVLHFNNRVNSLREQEKDAHFSVFALAPMPLLIKLGTLIGEVSPVEVYQLHREPRSWAWHEHSHEVDFTLTPPTSRVTGLPALIISLSATVSDDRIVEVMDGEYSIWKLSIQSPSNDFLRSKQLLSAFRKAMRAAFDRIKAAHGQQATLHIFPAMPLSAAVELGRLWMPKADLPMVVWDQNKTKNSFIPTITIQ